MASLKLNDYILGFYHTDSYKYDEISVTATSSETAVLSAVNFMLNARMYDFGCFHVVKVSPSSSGIPS